MTKKSTSSNGSTARTFVESGASSERLGAAGLREKASVKKTKTTIENSDVVGGITKGSN